MLLMFHYTEIFHVRDNPLILLIFQHHQQNIVMTFYYYSDTEDELLDISNICML